MVSLLYRHLYDHEPKKLTSSFLRRPSAINLHAFLTANSAINRVKIETAIQRARITTSQPNKAKTYLQMALNELVEVGFLKGYCFEGDVVVLERYPTEALRIRAIELQRKLEKKFRSSLKSSERRSEKANEEGRRKIRKTTQSNRLLRGFSLSALSEGGRFLHSVQHFSLKTQAFTFH